MILILSKEVWYEKVRFVLLLRSRGSFSDYPNFFGHVYFFIIVVVLFLDLSKIFNISMAFLSS